MNKFITLGLVVFVCLLAFVWLFEEPGTDAPAPSLVPETTDVSDESRPVDEVPELVETSWVWEETRYSESEDVLPNDPGSFVLSFIDAERFGAQTDCNNVAGTYTLEEDRITLSQMMSTKMACMNETQEAEFTSMLEAVETVSTDDAGRLLLEFGDGNGEMVFSFLPG